MTVDKFSLEAYELEDGNPPHGLYAHYGFQPSEGWLGNKSDPKNLEKTKQTIEKLANWDHKKDGIFPLLRVFKRSNIKVPSLKMYLDLKDLPVFSPEIWTERNPRLKWLSKELVHLNDPRFDFSRENAQFLKGLQSRQRASSSAK